MEQLISTPAPYWRDLRSMNIPPKKSVYEDLIRNFLNQSHRLRCVMFRQLYAAWEHQAAFLIGVVGCRWERFSLQDPSHRQTMKTTRESE